MHWCSGCGFASLGADCTLDDGVHGTPCRWCEFGTGRCHHCRGWWDLRRRSASSNQANRSTAADASAAKPRVYLSTLPEFDAVTGGGLCRDTLYVVGAPKASGKTSLLLLVADAFAKRHGKAMYASAEDSRDNTLSYCRELGVDSPNLEIRDTSSSEWIEDATVEAEELGCKLFIADSLQRFLHSKTGGDKNTTEQSSGVGAHLLSFARTTKIPTIVISHATRAGDYAGGEAALYDADVLVWMERLRDLEQAVRISVGGKSRRGPTDAVSYMEMTPAHRLIPCSPRLRAKIAGLDL